MNAKSIFILSAYFLYQHHSETSGILDMIENEELFALELEYLYKEGYLTESRVTEKGYNYLQSDPTKLSRSQFSRRLVKMINIAYNRKDMQFVKYLRPEVIQSIQQPNQIDDEVVVEFKRTIPQDNVVAETQESTQKKTKSKKTTKE